MQSSHWSECSVYQYKVMNECLLLSLYTRTMISALHNLHITFNKHMNHKLNHVTYLHNREWSYSKTDFQQSKYISPQVYIRLPKKEKIILHNKGLYCTKMCIHSRQRKCILKQHNPLLCYLSSWRDLVQYNVKLNHSSGLRTYVVYSYSAHIKCRLNSYIL